jgi:hypothetical protein
MAVLGKRLSTPSDWMSAPWLEGRERAGHHCRSVHMATVMQARLNLEHVQADEIRVKGLQMIPMSGNGDHGLHSALVGRGGERAPGPQSRRSAPEDGQSMLSAVVHPAGQNPRVVRVCGRYPACLPRKGQASWQTGALSVAGVARDGDWHGNPRKSPRNTSSR